MKKSPAKSYCVVSPLDQLIAEKSPDRASRLLIETPRDLLLERHVNPACVEGVLHGMGHMVSSFPNHRKWIEAAIGELLKHGKIDRPDLIAYARAARSGCVQ